MSKKLLLVSLVVLLLAVTVTPAMAGFVWCATDPNIHLPQGGVVHVVASVPQEYKNVPWTLDIWAPAGSRVVGNTGKITVVLHDGPAGQITAAANAGFPVKLNAKYKGNWLGEVIWEDGSGSITWTW
ncbi:MAG: hypothetical protein ACP5UQ_13510 [Anaerolineae bacterium]